MPSPVDKRLHAAIEAKEHEALLRIEGIADLVSRQVGTAAVNAATAAAASDMFGRSQRRTAEILRGIIPGISQALATQFRRLNWWSYNETVAIFSNHIPRRWYRRAIPQAVLVGEADRFAIDDTDLWADTFSEPVAGKRLSDAEWTEFLTQHLFPPPSKEAVDAVIYAPVAGLNWQQRLDILSHKITDMDKLAGILSTGASSGMSQAELKRQVQSVVQNISSSAARIARTEGLRIANQTQRSQYSQLGEMLAGVQIVATLDENTRPHHAARNGKIYWADPRKSPNLSELPDLPDEPNCRCYDTPVLHPPDEFENDPELRAEFLNAAGNSIPDPQVYSQWFDQADVGRRKQAVGVKRYNTVEKKLGRTPGFTDFIGTDGALLPIERLKKEALRDREERQRQVSQTMLQRQELLTKASRFGFVSQKNTGPATRIPIPAPTSQFHRGITAPVSNALELKGTKKQQTISTAVLKEIDKLHGDGDLPEIPLKWSTAKKWNGALQYTINRNTGELTAKEIKISSKSPHPHMTAAHEIGHFLDQQGIGRLSFASKSSTFSALFQGFNEAVRNSAAYKELDRLSGLNLKRKTLEHLQYLKSPEELFARAYAQWVASKSEIEVFRKELESCLPKTGMIPYQWLHEDFGPISEALDAMFQELGWAQ